MHKKKNAKKEKLQKYQKRSKCDHKIFFSEKQLHQLNVEQAKVKKSILLAAESKSVQ